MHTSILVLGDGNFSFSMALAHLIQDPSGVTLLATSFDDEAALQSKYPESASFIKRISARGGTVAHGVNACDLSAASLPAAVAQAMPYHHIIFHHPHIGAESMRKHRALLGHFFHQASKPGVLREEGMIHVSLGGTQPQDWQLVAQAARHGLELVLQTAFPTDELRGYSYEKKRHQHGRAFESSGLRSTAFAFTRRAHAAAGHDQASAAVHAKHFSATAAAPAHQDDTPGKAAAAGAPQETRQEQAHSDHKRPASPSTAEAPRPSQQRRTIPQLLPRQLPPWLWHWTSDAVDAITGSGAAAAPQPAAEWACEQCSRQFKSERGLKNHVHMVHELGIAPMKASSGRLTCSACGASFRSAAKLEEHDRRAHRREGMPDELPGWSADNVEGCLVGQGDGGFACELCGCDFACENDKEQHIEWLIPIEDASQCHTCGKRFAGARALQQHVSMSGCGNAHAQ